MQKEQLKEIIQNSMTTAFFGVNYGKTKEKGSVFDDDYEVQVFFTIPESVEIVNDKTGKPYTSKEIINIAKTCQNKSAKLLFQEEDFYDEEFIKEYENCVHFYAKIRKGEVWTYEMGVDAMKELQKKLNNSMGYEEV